MFGSNYYCLVAGLREYTLDAEIKGFDAKEIIGEILDELSSRDAAAVRLLYNYYDCENIAAIKSSRGGFNELGNFTREELEAELEEPTLLPAKIGQIIRAYSTPESEDARLVDTSISFERSLFEAYYNECAESKSRFLREWSQRDRNLRNVSAAITSRALSLPVEDAVVGQDDVAEQLIRSSAADFGLRGELPYLDSIMASIGDQENLLEKERKIDMVRWEQSDELSSTDYFNIDAVLAYLVKVNILARWVRLDATSGKAQFAKMLGELSGKNMINK
ncbi:MAG: DUF2764 family protein [Rikenellaceae bacterium]